MKTMLERTEGINFKKAFAIFFAALVGFGIIYAIAMTASGKQTNTALLLMNTPQASSVIFSHGSWKD